MVAGRLTASLTGRMLPVTHVCERSHVRRLSLDRGWRFHLGPIPGGTWHDALDDTEWRAVDLPHDWSIELERDPASPTGSDGGYFPAGVGWYQKRLSAPEAETGVIGFE